MSLGVSDLLPGKFYSQLVVVGQELLSVLYWAGTYHLHLSLRGSLLISLFAAILGYGLDQFIEPEEQELVIADEEVEAPNNTILSINQRAVEGNA